MFILSMILPFSYLLFNNIIVILYQSLIIPNTIEEDEIEEMA